MSHTERNRSIAPGERHKSDEIMKNENVNMNLEDIINKLNLQVYTGKELLKRPVKGAYASDLLSDVMGRAKEGQVWVTMQTHKNTIAVATLKELSAVIIVNGGKPDNNTLEAAVTEGIVLLGTKEGTYSTCGKLYKILERDEMV